SHKRATGRALPDAGVRQDLRALSGYAPAVHQGRRRGNDPPARRVGGKGRRPEIPEREIRRAAQYAVAAAGEKRGRLGYCQKTHPLPGHAKTLLVEQGENPRHRKLLRRAAPPRSGGRGSRIKTQHPAWQLGKTKSIFRSLSAHNKPAAPCA